jgi:hypothetical protein
MRRVLPHLLVVSCWGAGGATYLVNPRLQDALPGLVLMSLMGVQGLWALASDGGETRQLESPAPTIGMSLQRELANFSHEPFDCTPDPRHEERTDATLPPRLLYGRPGRV